MKIKKLLIFTGILAVSLTSFFISAKFFSPVKSTPVNYLKNQLSSAQLSYFARLDSTNTAGNSMIKIDTSAAVAPSTSNQNLFIGDTIAIANSAGGGSALYTVRDIANTNAIFIDPILDGNNASTGAYVVATHSRQAVARRYDSLIRATVGAVKEAIFARKGAKAAKNTA